MLRSHYRRPDWLTMARCSAHPTRRPSRRSRCAVAELDGLTYNKNGADPNAAWRHVVRAEDGQTMTRTIMTTCDNCGKMLTRTDGDGILYWIHGSFR